ncbi:TonB-dependent receptor [Avrilella dinanensis]|uniref:TonB-dependent receptor n=1 Tax=Avrilella dinanensis TaxID=2008672 RepID=UPI0024090186|nr:TonB-dependent receptor [Avrilella dinanensis]
MKRIFTLITLGITSFTWAQSGVISGEVTDAYDGFALPGASLYIEDSNRYTVSDQNGGYQFLDVPEGTYTVYVEYIGYTTEFGEIVVESGKTARLNFQMLIGDNTLEELVIVGDFLRGQAKALNQQKNNSNITNIISSDQVGRFPDANVGDALKRVPGITMQNDQGEARNIIIRGLSPELNSVTLNGDRIPSAEGDNRNVQMDLIPSDMISTIEVNKTLTPDMDADAIGGSVNLITRAVPGRERLSASLSGGFAPIRDKGIYNGSFIYGNRFLDNRLGIVASGTYQTQNFGSDNIEAVWDKDDNENTYLSEMDIRKYDVQRIRRSVSLGSDYIIDDNNRLDFNIMYNWRDDRENRFRTRYRDIELQDDGTYMGSIRRETKGGIDNNRNKNTRLEDQRVFNTSLKGQHLISSKLDMDWALSYSKASEERPNERYIDFQQKDVLMMQDLSNPNLPLVSAVNGENPADFELRKITENYNYTEESELGFKLNFRTPLSVIEGQKGRLRFGGRLRIKDKNRENNFFSYESIDGIGNLNEVPNQFFSGNGFNPGSKYAPGYFAQESYLGNLDLKNPALFDEIDEPSEYLALNYEAKENIVAGYIRWDQDITDKTSVIIGARIENTSIEYTGNYVLEEEELAGKLENSNSYTNILPGVTVKHNFTKDFILRGAITTGLARPNYYQLAPFVSATVEDAEIEAGNPNLKPTYATNFDLMIENYFENIGIVSAGVFYKKLNNFIYTYRNGQFTNQDFSDNFSGISNPIPAGERWEFTQARNGESVDVFGFEVAIQKKLDFLPGFLSNFSLFANYTFTDSKAKGITNEDGDVRDDLGLPRTAPHMLNGSLSWENDKFSARISANFTSDYLDEIGGNEFEDAYYDKQFFLDFNAAYKITPQFRIFAEANNLTNQPLRYYQGASNRMKQLEYYQPRYVLGLKFDL